MQLFNVNQVNIGYLISQLMFNILSVYGVNDVCNYIAIIKDISIITA